MPSFSDIVKSHKEMRDTITQIEALKKNIRTKEKEFNPDQEIALRSNQIGISGETNEAKKIIDDLVSNNVGNVVVLLKTLVEGIKSTELSPYNALVLWTDIRPKLRTSYFSISIDEASNNLSTIFNASQTKKSYTKTEIKTIEELIDVINKEVSVQIYPPLQASDIKAEMSVLLKSLVAALPTPPGTMPTIPATTPVTTTTTTLPATTTTATPPAGVPITTLSGAATLPAATTPSSIYSAIASFLSPKPPLVPPVAPPLVPTPPELILSASGDKILIEIEGVIKDMNAIGIEVQTTSKDIEKNKKKIPTADYNKKIKNKIKDYEDDLEKLEKIIDETPKTMVEARKTNNSIKPVLPTDSESSPALNELKKIQRKVKKQYKTLETIRKKTEEMSLEISGILAVTPPGSASKPVLSPTPPLPVLSPTPPLRSPTPALPPALSPTPELPVLSPTPALPVLSPTPALSPTRLPFVPLEFMLSKDEAEQVLKTDDLKKTQKFKDLKNHISNLQYIKEENGLNRFTISSNIVADWLAVLWLIGQFKDTQLVYLSDMFKETPKKGSIEKLDLSTSKLKTAQNNQDKRLKDIPSSIFTKDIVSGRMKPYTKKIVDEIFPKTGSGMKRGSGLGNMKQIISRTEDLISVAQQGHKTAEVRNELDTHLSMLIDKKKITPQYRDTIMKKLFR